MSGTRTPLIVGNWKLNPGPNEALDLARACAAIAGSAGDRVEVGIAAPFPYLPGIADTISGSRLRLGAQDVSAHESGAYTGEVAAGMIAALVYRFPEPLDSRTAALPLLGLVFCLSFFMVSKIRYYSFKDLDLRRRQPPLVLLFLALVLAAVFTHPQVMLLLMASTYVVHGLLLKLWSLFSRSKAASPPSDVPVSSEDAHQT